MAINALALCILVGFWRSFSPIIRYLHLRLAGTGALGDTTGRPRD